MGDLSWRRLRVLLINLPGTSRSHQAVMGERWDRTDQILAGIFDQLARANWQRAGNKRATKPEPLPRPGVSKGRKFGTVSRPIDEWRRTYAERFPERAHRTSGLMTTH